MNKINIIDSLRKFIISSLVILFIWSYSDIYAQKNQINAFQGGKFDFGKYVFSTSNLYKEIPQDRIKVVRLSVREISPSDPNCSFLFYPQKQEGNQTSLMDLLTWAIRQKGLPFYDFFYDSLFSRPLPAKDLDHLLKRGTYSGDSAINIDISMPSSYRILEASIYGYDNKVIAVRPIGLTPVSNYVVKNENGPRQYRTALFQVYFPDIMDILSHYYPSEKIRGIKTGLDLFIKNLYGGTDISRICFSDFLLLLNDGFDSTQIRHGFDTLWLSERLKNGIFINPLNSKLNGNPQVGSDRKTTMTEEFPVETANISCTRIAQKLINLRDTLNYPVYFPMEQGYGNRNLSDVILEGLRKGNFIAFKNFSDTSLSEPLTFDELDKLMSETRITIAYSDGGNMMKDTIIRIEYPASDIKYYYLKEAEFYDSKNNYIGSRPISLCPILEKLDPDVRRVMRKPLFEIPFSDKNFKSTLAQNNVTWFRPEPPMSFLSFLVNKKYRIESADTLPSSLSDVMRQLGLQPPPPENDIINNYNSRLSDLREARLVTREINKPDTANYQLFYPDYQHYGLVTFFDLLRDALMKGKVNACAYNQSDMPGEILSGNDLKNLLEQQVSMIDPETGVERIEHFTYSSEQIEKFLIRELVTDSIVIPIAICPVRGNQYSESYVNLFWVYFSEPFRKITNAQEVLRLNCEAERSFYQYLLAGKYKGTILNEKPLMTSDVTTIIQKLK